MRIVFVSYNSQFAYTNPVAWVEKIKTFAAFMSSLATKSEVSYIKQIDYEGNYTKDKVAYIFIRSRQKKSFFPFRINNRVKMLTPDIVIVSGIRSPLQIMQLKWKLGRKTKLIGRHHADHVPGGIRKLLQRWTDQYFDSYLFTSAGDAQEWIDAGVISHANKIFELPEASTAFSRKDRLQSRIKTSMQGDHNFLWVGRLNENKDPVTVLRGFQQYLNKEPHATLYMIFQTDDLLSTITSLIEQDEGLKKAVHLVGEVPYEELAFWYSAADFFISASHREGGSYALLEAMACGCIPIVTAIPAALKMTGNGKYAIVFNPGDVNDLVKKMEALSLLKRMDFSNEVETYFKTHLSSGVLAARLYQHCQQLLLK